MTLEAVKLTQQYEINLLINNFSINQIAKCFTKTFINKHYFISQLSSVDTI